LEAALGVPAETWMDQQRDYDLERQRNLLGGDLARIRRRVAQPDLRDVF